MNKKISPSPNYMNQPELSKFLRSKMILKWILKFSSIQIRFIFGAELTPDWNQ